MFFFFFLMGSLTRDSKTVYFPHLSMSFWSPNFHDIKHDFLSRWASNTQCLRISQTSLLNLCKDVLGPREGSHPREALVSDEVQQYRSEVCCQEKQTLLYLRAPCVQLWNCHGCHSLMLRTTKFYFKF